MRSVFEFQQKRKERTFRKIQFIRFVRTLVPFYVIKDTRYNGCYRNARSTVKAKSNDVNSSLSVNRLRSDNKVHVLYIVKSYRTYVPLQIKFKVLV